VHDGHFSDRICPLDAFLAGWTLTSKRLVNALQRSSEAVLRAVRRDRLANSYTMAAVAADPAAQRVLQCALQRS
jgi:hypothetical protein